MRFAPTIVVICVIIFDRDHRFSHIFRENVYIELLKVSIVFFPIISLSEINLVLYFSVNSLQIVSDYKYFICHYNFEIYFWHHFH